MSEGSRSILTARVVNIRARLIGTMLIILSLLLVAGVVYSVSLLSLGRAVAALEETLAQTSALPSEQQAALFAEVEAARRAMVDIPLAWAVLLGFAVMGVTLITVRSIAQPTERLTEVAEHLAEGKLEERVEIEWVDEFGRLGTAFNEMAERLQASYSVLERQVAERTVSLERRSNQLQAAMQVAREIAATLDLQELLSRVVILISERFGFYHAGIFLLDSSGEWAMLQAASSEGGRRMLAHGHRLAVGREGIVGYVTGRDEPRIALDVGADAVFFDNPYLPDTRSEMALPLRARGQIIGALDVQSKEAEAFSAEDVSLLQTLADQVALAISNAQLFRQAQESLEAERRAYGELGREAWQTLFRAHPDLGHRYDPQGILPQDGHWRDEMKRALREGELILSEEKASTALAIPLKVREQTIGVLDAHKPANAGAWTQEEVALLRALVDQLGTALDSARLYQDTQHRAARERIIGQVTTRIRETLDVDAVLRTAAQEMRQALGLSSMAIRLTTPSDEPNLGGGGLQ